MCFHVIDTLSDYLHSVQHYVEDFSPHKVNVRCEIGAHRCVSVISFYFSQVKCKWVILPCTYNVLFLLYSIPTAVLCRILLYSTV